MGVLLFQMLSGRLPFDADNPSALIFQHVYEQPPSLELIAPEIPAPLSAIIDKLLKKSPVDRHQTAEEILADLRAFRAGQSLPSESLASVGIRPERKTAIIHAPDFAEPPPLPADLMEDRALGWWQSTKDRALSLFRRHAPEALQRLQNTQQQVDGAIAEYERRQRRLLPIVTEAEEVLAELQAQESAWDTDAANGGSAAVSRDQIRQAIDQQQEQLSSMRVRLAQINATLSRLQSQRDLLNARLKVAQAQLQLAGAKPIARPRFWELPKLTWGVAAQVSVLMGVLCFGLFLIFDDPSQRNTAALPSKNEPLPPNPATPLVSKPVESEAKEETPVLPIRQFPAYRRPVKALAFHPQGTTLAAADDEGQVYLWDSQQGTEFFSFSNRQNNNVPTGLEIQSTLAFSRSGRWLVSSSSEVRSTESLRLWDLESEKLKAVLAGVTRLVSAVAFSEDDGSVLAAIDRSDPTTKASEKISVVRWSVDSGQELDQFLLSDKKVRLIQFSPDGTRLAVVPLEGDIELWNVSQGKLEKKLPLSTLQGHSYNDISSAGFDRDGSRLAVGTWSGVVFLWSTTDGSLLQKYPGFAHRITALSFGPHNRLLVGMASAKNLDQGEAQIVEPATSRVRRRLRGHAVYSAEYSPDGRWIATGGSQPFLLMWDAELPPDEISTPVWQESFRGHLAVAADGKSWLVAGQDQQVRFRKEGIDEWILLPEHSGKVSAASLSSDGRLAVVGGTEGELSLWRTEKKSLLRKTRLTYRGSFDLAQATRSGELTVRSLCFSADNRSVLALFGGTIIRWDVQSGGESVVLDSIGASCIAASPDGRHLITGGFNLAEYMGDLQLWDLETRQRVRSFNGHSHYVKSLGFSSDGSKFLSGGEGFVHVWNVETGEEIRRLTLRSPGSTQPSTRSAQGVAFSPDGRLVAATGHRMVSVWDAATGDELTRISGPLVSLAEMVGFTSDGEHLVSSAPNGSVALWEIPPQASKSSAEKK